MKKKERVSFLSSSIQKSHSFRWILCGLSLIIAFAACDDNNDPVPPPDPEIIGSRGAFILNQGGWGANDAGVTYYNFDNENVTFDITNGKLGALGQDILSYGNKVYVTASESGTIGVIDANEKTMRSIDVKDEQGASRQPYKLTCHNGKVYASTFDGHVIRIDTTSLYIEDMIKVGDNPDGIAYANDKLYIANSGGLNATGYDSTLSVISVASFKEIKRLTVGLNPSHVKADNRGNVYVCNNGNYDDIQSGFQRIDTKEDKVYKIEGINVYNFTIAGDSCFFYNTVYPDGGLPQSTYGIYNLNTQTIVSNQFITDGTEVGNPYAIAINPSNHDIYLGEMGAVYDAAGKVHVFNKDGKLKNTINVGIGPCAIAFH